MGTEPNFPTRCHSTRKKHFDEDTNNDDQTEEQQFVAESFRVNYFLVIIDMAVSSLTSRFE